jgi:hypothetical protein
MNTWFRKTRYPHIGRPLYESDRNWVFRYVQNPNKIEQHSFLPFLHATLYQHKYKKVYDPFTDELQNNGDRKHTTKARDIYYATHLDANIYRYYAQILNEKYNSSLQARGLNRVVTAYRKIIDPKFKKGMSNIDFAEEIFNFIRKSDIEDLVAVTFDIKSFFDNLDHKILKEVWKRVLKVSKIPNDHYKIFKNITQFSYINTEDIFNEFKNELIVVSPSGAITKKKVNKQKYLKNNNVIAFCEKSQFKEKVRQKGLIKSNKYIKSENGITVRGRGIPQGSPISAVLANMYLFDFDLVINEEVKEVGGLYRRYSDDIVIVCDKSSHEYLKYLIQHNIRKLKLEIQDSKTQSFIFTRNFDSQRTCNKLTDSGKLSNRKRFQYLGFEFDGQNTYLKSSSLAKFYRRMKKSIRRGAFYTEYSKYSQGHGKVFRTRLYNRFSYLGAKRKLKWQIKSRNPIKYERVKVHDWGNYLSYAKKAHFRMKNSKIKHQLRNHWKFLNAGIENAERRIRSREKS